MAIDPLQLFVDAYTKLGLADRRTGGAPKSPDIIRMGAQAARSIRLRQVPGAPPIKMLPDRDFWFPVGPQTITKSGSLNRNTFQIVNGGERAHAQGPTLGTITFDSFFPGPGYSRICLGLRDPQDFMEPDDACTLLENIRDSGTVVQLQVGDPAKIYESVQITDFSWSEVAGRPFDRTFSITFGIWAPEVVKVRGGVKLPSLPTVYQVRSGESLSDLALRMLGDRKLWKDIATKNKLPTDSPNFKPKEGTKVVSPLKYTETLNIPPELRIDMPGYVANP